MSLRNIVGKKKHHIAEPDPPPEDPQTRPPIIGHEAVIPEARKEGLKEAVNALRDVAQKTGGLSMTSVLSMDRQGTSMPDILQIPVGGRENDMYKMLERTRLTPYQKGLYAKAIWRAENGLGWGPLQRPIPQLGTFIVFHLRAAVSVNGESLAVFERTVASWEKMLYTQEAQIKQQQAKGISN